MALNVQMRVAGYSHYEAAISQCCPGEPLYLQREPDNKYDPQAIVVLNVAGCGPRDGQKIGYIPRARTGPVHKLLAMLDLMELDLPSHATIREIDRGEVWMSLRIDAAGLAAWFYEIFNRETIVDDTEPTTVGAVESDRTIRHAD